MRKILPLLFCCWTAPAHPHELHQALHQQRAAAQRLRQQVGVEGADDGVQLGGQAVAAHDL